MSSQTGSVANDVVIGQHPGARAPNGPKSLQGFIDNGSKGFGFKAGGEVTKIEGLVHFITSDVVRHFRQGHHPGFGAEHLVWTIAFQNLAPVLIHGMHAVLIPEWSAVAQRWIVDLFFIGQSFCLDEAVSNIYSESIDSPV